MPFWCIFNEYHMLETHSLALGNKINLLLRIETCEINNKNNYFCKCIHAKPFVGILFTNNGFCIKRFKRIIIIRITICKKSSCEFWYLKYSLKVFQTHSRFIWMIIIIKRHIQIGCRLFNVALSYLQHT